MKKILKITGVTVLVLAILLALAPMLFKGKIEDLVKKTINNNVNAQVEWADLDLSLFRSFPDATVVINDFTVINNAPFAGDTLASGKRLQIDMGVMQLFKNASDDPISVDALKLDEALVNIKIDSVGNANYDIAKETNDSASAKPVLSRETASKPFVFDLQQYEITDSKINYQDESNKTYLKLTEVNHEGQGDFSAVSSDLDTETTAKVSFDYDGINYLDNHDLDLTAVIQMDLENQKYTFKENSGHINALPLTFDGFVQVIEEGSDIDLSFQTPDSDFKNFLAVIPKTYAKNLDGVETSGDFRVSGKISGKATETTIPQLDIEILSNNASFNYPQLPKRMDNIDIDVKIKNETGNADDTYIAINALKFRIDDDIFQANGTLRNLTANMLVNLAIKGALDLKSIEQVYPLNLDTPLQGRLVADVTTAFDMNSVEKQQYQNIKSNGTASLSNFEYKTPELPNPIKISNANVKFNPGTITLNEFTATSGKTDMNATGSIENLIPFIMSKEDLKGRFNVKSKVFNLNDFAVAETKPTTKSSGSGTINGTNTTGEKSVKIPDFLDASLSFQADKVIYDNLELTNAKGTVAIANEEAQISGLNSGIFGGDAGLSGNVKTRDGKPTFDMTLDLSSIDIDRSFKELDMLKGLAPVAKALQGAFNTRINLKGQLDENFSPILSTIAGDAFAQILTAQVNPEQMPLLAQLDSKLDFINLNDLNLDKLKTTLTFNNGQVQVNPFDFKVKDIVVNVSGGHSFENVMNYNLKLDIPAKYLGSDVSGLLSKLTAEEKENLSVNLPVSLGGSFASPQVSLNTQSAISSLTTKIVDIQKQRAKDQVEDKLDDILGGILGGNKPKDSTATQGNGQTTDKPKTDEVIKDVATDILGGLFGKKKKKETAGAKKDSVNN
ncbi:AsmA family protein [Dokdonia sinensis]|uniref:AsmA family protein n=1 Tax=Dokdonia sinensis TaxID=2479847 RepID=A0A3M0FVN7_9FLAO|nr:AsmA family protein [Dokdonia sinensis]RMB56565.1 AsmA family protein [Dokdonia sinensis]